MQPRQPSSRRRRQRVARRAVRRRWRERRKGERAMRRRRCRCEARVAPLLGAVREESEAVGRRRRRARSGGSSAPRRPARDGALGAAGARRPARRSSAQPTRRRREDGGDWQDGRLRAAHLNRAPLYRRTPPHVGGIRATRRDASLHFLHHVGPPRDVPAGRQLDRVQEQRSSRARRAISAYRRSLADKIANSDLDGDVFISSPTPRRSEPSPSCATRRRRRRRCISASNVRKRSKSTTVAPRQPPQADHRSRRRARPGASARSRSATSTTRRWTRRATRRRARAHLRAPMPGVLRQATVRRRPGGVETDTTLSKLWRALAPGGVGPHAAAIDHPRDDDACVGGVVGARSRAMAEAARPGRQEVEEAQGRVQQADRRRDEAARGRGGAGRARAKAELTAAFAAKAYRECRELHLLAPHLERRRAEQQRTSSP